MKITIDLTSLADNFSGIERFALNITKELIRDDRHQFILLFKNKVHPEFNNINDRVEKIIIYGNRKLWFNQVKMPMKLLKIKADVFIFPAFPAPFLFFNKKSISAIPDLGCWDCPTTNKKHMIAYFKILFWKAAKNRKKIITISNFSKHRIMDILNVDEKNVWVINCGMSDTFLNYTENREQMESVRKKYQLSHKYLLCLSTLEPRKNLILLVRVYEKLILNNSIDCDLVLAGRKGWMIENLLENIDKRVIGRIKFTGFIDDNDLPCIYSLAELFVFPTLYEGFGIPPLEAMYMGTKVVSSDSSAMPEVLKDGAIFFKSNNEVELEEKIVMALEMKKENEAQIIKKAKTIASQYNWNEEANKLMRYLNEDSCY